MTKNNNNPGRPRENLALNGKFYRCIGLDIGGTHISGVILDFAGKIISKYSVEMSNTNISVLLQICELVIKELLIKAELTMDDIDEIGISIPGHIENKTGKTILAENLKGWENISVPKFFSEKYGKNVIVDDCSRLMGLAELRLGIGKGCEDFIVFDLGLEHFNQKKFRLEDITIKGLLHGIHMKA